MKTRYAKSFQGVQVKIPRNRYESYSGLLELFEKKGVTQKQGNLKYVTTAGEELLEYLKIGRRT